MYVVWEREREKVIEIEKERNREIEKHIEIIKKRLREIEKNIFYKLIDVFSYKVKIKKMEIKLKKAKFLHNFYQILNGFR